MITLSLILTDILTPLIFGYLYIFFAADSESTNNLIFMFLLYGITVIFVSFIRNYYNNYLTGFSDAKFTIVDIFGQGDKMVKHWNFKGTHDGDFFGVPATGKSVDTVSGFEFIKIESIFLF